jgi:transposase
VAPALIPRRAGERVKTNRRDAVTLARLHRAGELTGVWVPEAVHEAVRDLVRAREAAADDLRRKRQQLLSFLLRQGRIYSARGHWTLAHRRWRARQGFEHPAQQIVFQEGILDLALFVHRQHNGVLGRIDIEPHDVAQLLYELQIIGELELPDLVRLKAMDAPDALDRAGADAASPGHHRRGPVRGFAWPIAQGQFDRLSDISERSRR